MKKKFVKRANMWTVSYFTQPKSKVEKTIQHQEWFSTEEEANKFIEEKSK